MITIDADLKTTVIPFIYYFDFVQIRIETK